MNSTVETEIGKTHFHIAKGTEPMTFSKEFQEAVGIIKTDLSQVERRIAEDLCQKQDQKLRENLASQ